MTAIQGFIAPSRRPGELGIHSVDHFHFVVPDLAVAKNFYGEFGLDVGETQQHSDAQYLRHPHCWGSIGEGPRKKFGYMSFGAFEDDIERFAERLQAMGMERLDPPPGIDSNGIGFAITTASWSRSRSRRNRRRTKRTISVQVRRPGQRGASVPQRDAAHATRAGSLTS